VGAALAVVVGGHRWARWGQRWPAPQQLCSVIGSPGLLGAHLGAAAHPGPAQHSRAPQPPPPAAHALAAGPMALGDVSFHHGWMVHSAAPQPPGTQPRRALTVSFFADGARLLPREGSRLAAARHLKPGVLHSEDAESYGSWLRDLKGGARAVHEQLPLVWPPPRRRAGQPT